MNSQGEVSATTTIAPGRSGNVIPEERILGKVGLIVIWLGDDGLVHLGRMQEEGVGEREGR